MTLADLRRAADYFIAYGVDEKPNTDTHLEAP